MLIDLTEIKKFLEINDNTVNSELLVFISAAESRLNSLCGRIMNYQTHTEIFMGDSSNEIILKQYPIDSIISIKVLNTNTFEYEDFITIEEGKTLSDYYIIEEGKRWKLILKSCYFSSYSKYQITYIAGYKSNTVNKTITAISQSDNYAVITIGTHSYTAGTVFYTQNITGFLNNPNGSFVITDVTPTQIKIEFDLGTGEYVSGGTAVFNSTLFNSTPGDLILALFYLVKDIVNKSNQNGFSILGIESRNTGGQSSDGIKYKDIEFEIERLIQPYKVINV